MSALLTNCSALQQLVMHEQNNTKAPARPPSMLEEKSRAAEFAICYYSSQRTGSESRSADGGGDKANDDSGEMTAGVNKRCLWVTPYEDVARDAYGKAIQSHNPNSHAVVTMPPYGTLWQQQMDSEPWFRMYTPTFQSQGATTNYGHANGQTEKVSSKSKGTGGITRTDRWLKVEGGKLVTSESCPTSTAACMWKTAKGDGKHAVSGNDYWYLHNKMDPSRKLTHSLSMKGSTSNHEDEWELIECKTRESDADSCEDDTFLAQFTTGNVELVPVPPSTMTISHITKDAAIVGAPQLASNGMAQPSAVEKEAKGSKPKERKLMRMEIEAD